MKHAALLALLLAAACGRDEEQKPYAAQLQDRESCIGCHAELNPGLVADHVASPHASVPIHCEDCHGTDHEEIFAIDGAVPPTVCAECHAAAHAEFARSAHGRRLKQGKLDKLLLNATTATGGCTATNGCHSIQMVYEDGSIGRCGTCHASHAFRNEQARDPQVCVGCHAGADHPQHDAWLRSSHALRSPSHDGAIADCVECHGAHAISDGIVRGLPPVDAPAAKVQPPADPKEFAKQRELMSRRCRKCHSERRTRETLETADAWRNEGAHLLDRAGEIVRALHRDGLLDPSPADRVGNPIVGHALRLGGAQIFDREISLPERLYYEMYFHHYPALWRAAYHTDPTRITWEANDALKSALDRIREIDRDLRREGPAPDRTDR